MNNLQKRNIFIVEWCCMCKNNWESADHLLLQCDYAQVYGFCCLFVFHWDMPKWMVDSLACWKGGFSKHHCADSWGAIPLCYVDYLERMKPMYLIPYKGLSIGLWS